MMASARPRRMNLPARLNRHQSKSRVQEQQQLKSSSRSAVREAGKEQKQQWQHQQKQDSAPQSDEATSAEETVVTFHSGWTSTFQSCLSTDPNVDRLLATLRPPAAASILVDHLATRSKQNCSTRICNRQQQQSKNWASPSQSRGAES
uniref:Uncharacterized protein n=1 Tax=Macrostomum lignano TaxID=282301 RepID=A0A1I8FFJ8_9PLAT